MSDDETVDETVGRGHRGLSQWQRRSTPPAVIREHEQALLMACVHLRGSDERPFRHDFPSHWQQWARVWVRRAGCARDGCSSLHGLASSGDVCDDERPIKRTRSRENTPRSPCMRASAFSTGGRKF